MNKKIIGLTFLLTIPLVHATRNDRPSFKKLLLIAAALITGPTTVHGYPPPRAVPMDEWRAEQELRERKKYEPWKRPPTR